MNFIIRISHRIKQNVILMTKHKKEQIQTFFYKPNIHRLVVLYFLIH